MICNFDDWRVRIRGQMAITKFLIALEMIGAVCGLADAADISVSTRDRNGFTFAEIELSGPIMVGDGDLFLERIRPLERKGLFQYEGSTTLYLSSDGGNFTEGLKIAEQVRSKGIATRVRGSHRCFSACAIIFMHGVVKTLDGEEYIDRKISRDAILGFHAPYLVWSGKDADRRAVEFAYSAALRQLSRLLESGNKIIGTELLIRMLRTPPGDILVAERFGDLIMWNITLSDAPEMRFLSMEQIAVACLNAWSTEQGDRSEVTLPRVREILAHTLPITVKSTADGYLWYQFETDDYYAAKCNLKVKKDSDGKLDIRLMEFSYSQDEVPDDARFGYTLPYRYFQPADGLIRQR